MSQCPKSCPVCFPENYGDNFPTIAELEYILSKHPEFKTYDGPVRVGGHVEDSYGRPIPDQGQRGDSVGFGATHALDGLRSCEILNQAQTADDSRFIPHSITNSLTLVDSFLKANANIGRVVPPANRPRAISIETPRKVRGGKRVDPVRERARLQSKIVN